MVVFDPTDPGDGERVIQAARTSLHTPLTIGPLPSTMFYVVIEFVRES
jgi:hypothetical protein